MKEALEYDIFIDLDTNDIHLITYLLEGEAHLMSVRNRQEDGYLKIISPKDSLDDALSLINSVKEEAIKMEVVKIEPHNGIV
ncbi:MAG: DUF4911 domain-containing protein [Thermotogota bacterium]